LKKFLLSFLCAIALGYSFAQVPCENGYAGTYQCSGVDLMSRLSIPEIGGGQNLNDCWGWTSPTGKEIAIIGRSDGTSFIDISDPIAPVYLGNLPTHTTPSLWRDIKVYQNHAFIVAEAGGHGMQVFNLLQLENIQNAPAVFGETAHYPNFGNAHNIAINESTGYAYAAGSNTFQGGLHIIDITNPTQPQLAGGFEQDGYTHDAQIVIYQGPDADYAGREIALCCNEDFVTLADVSDKTDCQLISTMSYPNVGYVHQGWLTEDHRFFLQNDELDEMNNFFATRTHIWNVEDLDSPAYIGYYSAPVISSDHNLYTKGNAAYLTNYLSGLRVVDITNVASGNLEEIAFFDTEGGLNIPGFNGTWSNYPWFESGNIVLSSMQNGMFIVRLQEGIVNLDEPLIASDKTIHCWPNPASGFLQIEWLQGKSLNIFDVYDRYGRLVRQTELSGISGRFSLDISDLPSGMYLLKNRMQGGISLRFIAE